MGFRAAWPQWQSRSRSLGWARAQVRRTRLGRRLAVFRDRWKRQRVNRTLVSDWEAAGRPVPPPHPVKQRAVRAYARRYRLRVLVETGTFRGEMVEAMRRHFGRVVSIELGEEMHRRAAERFAGCPTVEILQGDSGVVLAEVLETLAEPALFWLDGHYSEGDTAHGDVETPIVRELEHILRYPMEGNVILIDDARDFNGTRDYPTLDGLAELVRVSKPSASFEVADDIIRIV